MTLTWAPGRPRLLVAGGSLTDAGDAAVAIALDGVLRSLSPRAAILHAVSHGGSRAAELPGLAFVPPLGELVNADPALVAGADLVVGGGTLFETGHPVEALQALAGVIDLGCPVALVGLTVGRWRGTADRACLRRVLRSAEAVVVRDPASVAHALELGAPPDRLTLGGDVTLSLFAEPPTVSSGEGVAVVIDPESELADLVIGDVTELAPADKIIALSSRTGLAALITAIGSHRAVVSTTLHPALWALAQGVPAALLTDSQEAEVLRGVDIGAARCTRPEDRTARRAAIGAALDARGARGPALWHALAAARHRTVLNAPALLRVLADLPRAASQRQAAG